MIETAIIISLIANFLININPVYQYIINRWLNYRPFNCVVCISFWIALLYSITIVINGEAMITLLLPVITPFIASMLHKVYNNLPTPLH